MSQLDKILEELLSSEQLKLILEEFEIINQTTELLHKKTGLEFKYIEGGFFNMGLSEDEEAAAIKIHNPPPLNINEMRPCHQVIVSPFLITKYPILNRFASRFLPIDSSEEEEFPFFPAFLNRNEVLHLASILNMRLPSEEEWEYACRGGTDTIFFFGNELPSDNQLNKILSWDFSDPKHLIPNPFGLYGLFSGEWCSNEYRLSYEHDAPVEHGSYVIRGGGAIFWPWQDQEWVWCMSSIRMPSKDLFEDGKCGFRLVFSI